jgi:hypothetical protein
MRLARIVIGLLATLGVSILLALPISALETIPSVEAKTNGPLLITGYSLQGHSLRYVQVANTSDEVVPLEGWSLQVDWAGGSWAYPSVLSGLVEPNKKITIANESVVPSATFVFRDDVVAAAPRLSTIRLIPPLVSGWNDVTAEVSGNDVVGSVPALTYVTRNISSSTGLYLSSFTTFVPDDSFQLQSDELYMASIDTDLRVVEIYPRPNNCSPVEETPLCNEYIKLYNSSSQPINLGQFRLRSGAAGQTSSTSNTTHLPTVLLPAKSYVSYPIGLVDGGAWVWIEDIYGLTQYDSTVVSYPSASAHQNFAWSLNPNTTSWQWTQYPTPYNTDNVFSQDGVINNCEGLRLSEIAANHSPQFIELVNRTTKVLDISGCQLQTNRSQTASYVFADDTHLAAGEYVTIAISSTDLSLTKTTNGTVYLLNSEGSLEVDARNYDNLDDNTSLALVGGKWLQTFTVTPGGPNEYTQYPACQIGYIRNEATGRCNKQSIATALTPCLSTQYRSKETNRCRNNVSLSTAKPCAANQYRNPATNRCRLISSTASNSLKPCNEGQKRNPATNRCRSVGSSLMPTADFPVKTSGSDAQSSISWVAFGLIGALAAAYGGWEWRYEILNGLRKLKGLVTKV